MVASFTLHRINGVSMQQLIKDAVIGVVKTLITRYANDTKQSNVIETNFSHPLIYHVEA